MSRSVSLSLLIGGATLLGTCVIAEPGWLCDKSPFLKDFLNKEILSILGVILTITLASAAQLHLEFNKIEETHKKKFLKKSRSGVHGAAFALIWIFVIAAILVVMKPIVAETDRHQAVFNSIGLFLLWFNVIILVELTQAAFSIQPYFTDDAVE